MKYFIGFVLGIAFILLIADYLPEQEGRYYNCEITDWHPDIPPAVREECRKLRQENWNDYSRKTT